MELFRSQSCDELVFSSYISYEEEFEAYIHDDDVRDFYMDDDELEHGLFDEVDPNSFEIYKEWCYQQHKEPSHYTSLKLYFDLMDGYGDNNRIEE